MVIYDKVKFKTSKTYRLQVLEELMKFKHEYVIVLDGKVTIIKYKEY